MIKTTKTNTELLVPFVNIGLYELIKILKKTDLSNTLEFAEFTYETFERELQRNINDKTH